MGKHMEQRAPRDEEIVKILEEFKYGHPGHFALAQEIFSAFVDPEVGYQDCPGILEQQQCDMAFTEWTLFDMLFENGDSLITIAAKEHEEFTEYAATQFYGRFWVVDRRPHKGICVLRDVCSQRDYEVASKHIARNKRWCKGTIGTRIARVQNKWIDVGQLYLHDNADWDPLPPRIDDEDDPYDPFAFITNVEQVIGHRGEYRKSASAHVFS